MPESFISPLDDRCSALEHFAGTQCAQWHGLRTPSSNRNSYGRSQPAIADGDRLKAAIFTPKVQDVDTTDGDGRVTKHRGKRARAKSEVNEEPRRQSPLLRKGSSVHYGVRFRPDLRKWVAEIRVAEWKDVDKKVWLGTFDTEDAAARGVDLARKLLKCTKKRPPNLPCQELDLYSTKIPPHLVLTDITNDAMFKDVVQFIKNECQAYAASFPPTTPTTPVLIPHPQSVLDPNTLGYEEVDVLWNDDDYELGLYSDSEFCIPDPGPDHNLPNHGVQSPGQINGMEVLNMTDFMDGIFEEAFQPFAEFDSTGSSSRGSSAPSSFSPEQFQYQFRDGVGASPVRQAAAWETRCVQEEMELDPVCHSLAAEYLPHAWPGPASASAPFLPLHSGATGDMTYFDFENHWSLQGGDYQFQMDMH